MKVEFKNDKIKLNRILSVLDKFVIDFVQILDQLDIGYVIISGYIPLLFGRQRITEDIDIFIDDIDGIKLKQFYDVLSKKYWIMNANSFEHFESLWHEKIAPRAAQKGEISPNMEIKRLKSDLDRIAMEKAIKVELNEKHLIRISPLELQIAYKLFLGSKKDLEDARFLFDLFRENLDMKVLSHFATRLNALNKMNYLGVDSDGD